MSTKYVASSPSIDAVQWTGENLAQMGQLALDLADVMLTGDQVLRVRPIEVTVPEVDVPLGDWLVGAGNRLVALTAEAFDALFEPAEPAEPNDPDGGSAGDPVATPRVDAVAETFAFEGGFD